MPQPTSVDRSRFLGVTNIADGVTLGPNGELLITDSLGSAFAKISDVQKFHADLRKLAPPAPHSRHSDAELARQVILDELKKAGTDGLTGREVITLARRRLPGVGPRTPVVALHRMRATNAVLWLKKGPRSIHHWHNDFPLECHAEKMLAEITGAAKAALIAAGQDAAADIRRTVIWKPPGKLTVEPGVGQTAPLSELEPMPGVEPNNDQMSPFEGIKDTAVHGDPGIKVEATSKAAATHDGFTCEGDPISDDDAPQADDSVIPFE